MILLFIFYKTGHSPLVNNIFVSFLNLSLLEFNLLSIIMSKESNTNNQSVQKEKPTNQNGNSENGATNGSTDELHIVSRIYEIPVIQDGVNAVKSYVNDSNSRYVHFVADTANSAFTTAVKVIKPVQNYFQRQIQQVDALGCQSLDYLEGKFPLIKKPTNEVVETCRSTVEPYVSKVAASAQNLYNTIRNALPRQ
ncbi:hypothetical protein K7432_000227 [Basidiobolus ranarum]|uniref:Uncharacterized protein n=1 Tax=Basidiobolus ranarum TaxID=34480 RepID=A0ABR2WBL6_9FUNG